MTKWFICQKEQVDGPYTSDQVQSQIEQGEVQVSWMIWGGSQNEWITIANWLNSDHELSQVSPIKQLKLWHWAYEGNSEGPMTREKLIQEIRQVANPSQILLWTKGMGEWATIFEFHDILDDIGVNRREFPRAKIAGRVTLTTEDENTIIGNLQSISQGGFGVSNLEGLKIGQVVNIEIQSKDFYQNIAGKAEVRYITDTGYAGFLFKSLGAESQSTIVEYVRSNSLMAKIEKAA